MHETSLPSPETVDLGGRCVLPGFTDSHVHFPTWALVAAATSARTAARRSPRRSTACARRRATGSWLRGQGWRDADWPDGPPTRQALDEIVPDRPAMLISKDYHALWLNSAALALAGGDLEVEGGVVVRDEHGEPTGVLYEEAAWRFKARFVQIARRGVRRRDARRRQGRGLARRHCLHDKDGWLGAIGLWQQLEQQGGAAAPRLAVDARPSDCRSCARSACAAASALRSSGSAT